MREKTLNSFFDNLLWYLVYLLPLLIYIGYSIRCGSLLTLSECMTACGLGILSTNPIFSILSQIFGAGGILPFFVSEDILLFGSWFISTFIVHLLVDFVLFIPRLCHKWFSCLYGEK